MNPAAKKILLVEDEDFIRELYTRQLVKAGFAVKSAVDGQSGLELLKTEQFDLLLLDIMLPGMNGLQLLREFKTQSKVNKWMHRIPRKYCWLKMMILSEIYILDNSLKQAW